MEKDKFVAATERARRQQRRTPPATAARYDRRLGRIIIQLGSGLDLMLDPQQAEGLEEATPGQLSAIEITPSGLGLHFPKLDADVYVPGLLEGVLGSKKWMASTAWSFRWPAHQPREKACLTRQRQAGW